MGWLCLLGLAVFAATANAASANELHAIAIGFNQYQHVQKLRGAEADASDIAAVLGKRGVKDVVIMSDPQTRIADFKTAWAAMTARSAPGDMMMLSFAGDGARLPETRSPMLSPDSYEEGFLFPTYDQDLNPDELLRGEVLYDLFKETAAKGLRVLFIADAGHAGTGIRCCLPFSAPLRFQRFDLKGAPPPTPLAVAPPPRPPIPSVAVIAAQIQGKAVIEINVDGVLRGALSYAVARGLEGAADREGTGITVDKLWRYVRPVVRERSENYQAPDLFDGASDGAMTILSAAAAPQAAATIVAAPAPASASASEAAPSPSVGARRVALVVGNSDYNHAPRLANPTFDADLVSESLRKIGFEVTEVKDADFAALDAALVSFAAKEDGPEVVLFYYAGLGLEIGGSLRPRMYLLPTSADLGAFLSETALRRDAMPLDEVIDRISAPATTTLAFIDAGREDLLHQGDCVGRFDIFHQVDISSGRQLFIGMSTQIGSRAPDGEEGKASRFAQGFVEAMATPGLRIDDAFRQLRDEVAQKTQGRQIPEVLHDDLRRGAFVLVGAP